MLLAGKERGDAYLLVKSSRAEGRNAVGATAATAKTVKQTTWPNQLKGPQAIAAAGVTTILCVAKHV